MADAALLVALRAPPKLSPPSPRPATAAGEAVLTWTLLGRFVWVVPNVLPSASLLLGSGTCGDLAWWAWLSDPSRGPVSLALSVGLSVVGLAANGRRCSTDAADQP